MRYFNLPFIFLKFWYVEAPLRLIRQYTFLNRQFMHLFSLPILIRSYFKPWKNEYRKEFIVVAIGIGIFVKTFFIIADTILFLMLLLIEFIFLVFFLNWPFLTIVIFFL